MNDCRHIDGVEITAEWKPMTNNPQWHETVEPEIVHYAMAIRAKCKDCGAQMAFPGPVGVDMVKRFFPESPDDTVAFPYGPSVSEDAITLYIPVFVPEGMTLATNLVDTGIRQWTFRSKKVLS